MANQNEASVEEILESIKKVIARDSRETVGEGRNREPRDDSAALINNTEPANHEEAEEVLDLAEMELSDAVELSDDCEDAPLIADEVRGAMQENFAALAMLSEPPARPQIVRSGETSLEGMTRDLLRPMLAEWLDKNLPGMVEKMVQAEIARIAGKRG